MRRRLHLKNLAAETLALLAAVNGSTETIVVDDSAHALHVAELCSACDVAKVHEELVVRLAGPVAFPRMWRSALDAQAGPTPWTMLRRR